jgi:hypothetical protein
MGCPSLAEIKFSSSPVYMLKIRNLSDKGLVSCEVDSVS